MGDQQNRGDKKKKELEGQGPELAERMGRAKTYQEELQHYTAWANERIAQGLSPNSRHMTTHIQEHPMVARLRADPRLGKPPYGFGTPHFASIGRPQLDRLRPPARNPNEVYYVSPGGGLKLTLGELASIGRMMSDDEWLSILCGWSPMQHAHSMGMSGGEANSVEYLLDWLNKNIRLDLPDYTAACFDMYYAGMGIREGYLTFGVSPAMRPPVYKAYPLKTRPEAKEYSLETSRRYPPMQSNQPPPKPSPIVLSKSKFGHTFTNHGEKATEFLTQRAKASGMPQGQFLDDQAAARFIQDNIGTLKNGPASLPAPAELPMRVIMPDGTFVPGSQIRLVPSGGGVKTAYPEL